MFLKHGAIFKFENVFYDSVVSWKIPTKNVALHFISEKTASFFSSFSKKFPNKIIIYKQRKMDQDKQYLLT